MAKIHTVAANALSVLALSSSTRPSKDSPPPPEPYKTASPSEVLTDGTAGDIKSISELDENAKDGCSSCANSVKRIDMHIVVCTPGPWGKRVESQEGSFIHDVNKIISETIKCNSLTAKVMLTACDRLSSSDTHVDVILYPQAQMYRVSRSAGAQGAKAFVEHILLNTSLPVDMVLADKLPWSKLVLICNHAARDKRCGKAGPILIDEFNEQLPNYPDSSKVAVFGTSHIGGHAFAGTLIIYPEGKSFGFITKNKVATLLDYICNGNMESFEAMSASCYRGQYNESW